MIIQAKQGSKLWVLGIVLILTGTEKISSEAWTMPSNSDGGTENQVSYYFYHQQSEFPRDCSEMSNKCSYSTGVYLIKPDGYSDAFDAYCDSNGYTVIGRREFNMSAISFNRSWEDYDSGFGFPSKEFWLGNKKLSYLTNQKEYQLCIDVTLSDGSTFYVSYDRFRISDAYSNYRLLSAENYQETIVTCPANMFPGNCTCQRSCADPENCIPSACHVTGSCVCPDGFLMNDGYCIYRDQCRCFLAEVDDGQGIVLQEGGVHLSPNCSRKCSCTLQHLDCEDDFQCSPHGTCEEWSINGWNCSCNEGYEGDGKTCSAIVTAADCQDVFNNGNTTSGVYNIDPVWSQDPFQVYCNMTDGGGWLVVQRQDGSGDFYRYWNEYKNGFGDLEGGMWLGNDKIHNLTNQKNYTLRIDLTETDGRRYYATYNSFRINDETDRYRLASLGTHEGSTGNVLNWHLDKLFSTRDQDNDGWSTYDCAEQHKGGWWFGYDSYYGPSYSSSCRNHHVWCELFPVGNGCAKCAETHLNADYHSSTRGTNIFWNTNSGYCCNLLYTEMRIRPVQP